MPFSSANGAGDLLRRPAWRVSSVQITRSASPRAGAVGGGVVSAGAASVPAAAVPAGSVLGGAVVAPAELAMPIPAVAIATTATIDSDRLRERMNASRGVHRRRTACSGRPTILPGGPCAASFQTAHCIRNMRQGP